MEIPALRYAFLRDRRSWQEGIAWDDLVLKEGGVLVLRPVAPSGTLRTTTPLDAGELSEWARVRVTAKTPAGTDVRLLFCASEKPDAPIGDRWVRAHALDALVPKAPSGNGQPRPLNRYLWLQVRLVRMDESAPSPRLIQVQAQTAGESYLDYLPALYRAGDSTDGFLARWLALFQSQLGDQEGVLETMPSRLDPATTPDGYLPWLASWLGCELPPELHTVAWLVKRYPELTGLDPADAWRELLPCLYALYGRRGTPFGIREFVELYAGVRPHIFEAFQEHRVWQLAPDRAVERCDKIEEPGPDVGCDETDWDWWQTSRLGVDTGLAATSPEGMVVSGFHTPDPRYQGLRGDYYADEFRLLRFSRVDPQVAFNWTPNNQTEGVILEKVAGDYQTPQPNATLQLMVRVVDTDGNPVQGELVTFQVASGDGSVTPETRVTAADGCAGTDWTLGQDVGMPMVRASLASGAQVLFRAGEPSFAVRWTGQVQFPHTDTVTFYIESSGAVRLWVGGRLIIDNWQQHDSQERSGQVRMEAGRWYTIRLDYYYATSNAAHVKLSWASRRVRRQVIPSVYLYADMDESVLLAAPTEATGDGETILVGQTVVGEAGPLEKRDYGMPLFSDTAHLFTVLLPAAAVPEPEDRRALVRILEAEKPAHTDYHLCLVEPLMRVGRQARLGVDSIVAKKLAIITGIAPGVAGRMSQAEWSGLVSLAWLPGMDPEDLEAWKGRVGLFHVQWPMEKQEREQRGVVEAQKPKRCSVKEEQEQDRRVVVTRLGIANVVGKLDEELDVRTLNFHVDGGQPVEGRINRYLVHLHLKAKPGIDAADALACRLDVDFPGTRLPESLLDDLMTMAVGEEKHFPSTFQWDRGLRETGARLPSGDGLPGGRFHSWFEIAGEEVVE